MILPVVMAGGSGTRLWPLSRGNYPKQFLKLHGEKTMLQNTITRLSGIEHQSPLFICNEEHRFIAAEQIRHLGIEHNGIILEPVGRNTAPAIALAAFKSIKSGDDPLLLVLAADHVINDEKNFIESVLLAKAQAEIGKLVTFGIVANKPETGYGYIKSGEPIGNKGFKVAEFVEKPDLSTAEKYLATGDYFWNSGMFMFKASRYLEELQKFSPEIYAACEKAISVESSDLDFIRINKDAFEQCPDDSIDYAVMENTSEAVVVPMDAQWNDVGGFSALWEVSNKDESGNAINGDAICVNTKNTLIEAGEKLIATFGVEDLVIINTKDAVLVAHKDQTQGVKQIVNQ